MLGTIVDQTLNDQNLEIIIASGDMDTLQLVSGDKVRVFTLKKGIKDTIMYDENTVVARFGFGPKLIPDYKGLRGDPSDNIIGIKGIGEKTATILISTFGTIENIYKELGEGNDEKFKKVGITPRIIELLKANKEEAEFSKMLATIRRDAPIQFIVPEKTFKETIEAKKISGLWHELEFRTLYPRLEQVLNNSSQKKVSKNVENDESQEEGGTSTSNIWTNQNVDPEDLEKTSLALWLVDSNITNPKIDDVINFANALDYEKAKQAIFEELDRRNLRNVYEKIELPLIPIVKKMELHGVKIDRKLLNKLSTDYHRELNRLEKKIHEFAGMEFNINSPKQLGEVLFDKLLLTAKNLKKTSGGARSTRESELEKLRDSHPIVPLIFEYRELQKLLSTYIDAIPAFLDSTDRLHSHFVSAGTTTGRMASIDPNLQNIPVKSELGKAIRGAFIADKGYKLCSFDYSQIELRIAAFLSGDQKLLEIFRKGEDVHTSVASFVFKVPMDKVTSDMRRQAKVINFGIIYGMGVVALRQNLGTTRDEAQKFLNDYFETFNGLAAYLDGVKAETERKGYTETFFGRRRYFEGIKSKIPYIKASAERMAINAPIQGTEADIIKLAMIAIDKYINEKGLNEKIYPVLQVHDELVYEVKEEEVPKIVLEIEKIMEKIMTLEDTKGVALKSSTAVGDNWGELK
jgi:DNA polymerase-1